MINTQPTGEQTMTGSQTQSERYLFGDAYKVGSVLKGFGLSNAGRSCTVLTIGNTKGRVRLEEHLTGRKFWTFDRYYRVTQ